MSTFHIQELDIGLESCTHDKAVEISVGKSGKTSPADVAPQTMLLVGGGQH